MSTYPHYPKRPHDSGSLFGVLVVAVVMLIVILVVTN
jgi:hypothetical protein